MSNLHVSTSPLTNRIHVGKVNKDGNAYINKEDITGAACGAVAEHVIANGEPVVVMCNGVPKYRISVEVLKGGAA